jgi:hypothetical protein
MANIYESPDGGETVYVRNTGSTDRQLHHVSSKQTDLLEQMREDQLWYDIRRKARVDPGLQELLEPAIMYYKLKYDNR